ncbi:MAG TPA: HlyD family efflux transporter periplasmic adaptor subunit [Chloroflexi bacterium]|jgi:HlyD family secretion protein|nr:HlyD family efflux transporter periplasmic adaptor subunit [Chloroflexota bacterium]
MRYRRTLRLLVPTLAVLLAATGCAELGGSREPTAEPSPVVVADTRVVADGRIVPRRWAALASSTGGRVVAISVEEGQPVSAGEELLRVDDGPQRVALAEAEAALAAARAQLAQLLAGATTSELDGAEAALAAARAAVQAAEGAVTTARANLNRLQTGATAEEREIAQRSVELAKNALWAAQGQRDAVCGATAGGAPGSCDAAKGAVQQAEEQVRIAEVQLRQVEQGASPQEIAAAQGQVQQALGQLEAARADAARAEAVLNQLVSGATPEAIAAAEAQVAQAEAAADRAALMVARCGLEAPFAGRVVAVDARLGEEIGPGVPVLRLADTSAWRVETDDLTELDVVRVVVGQRVTVVADALPEVVLEGTVASIAETSEVRAGEVLYKVTIDLPDPDPRLRWGMTVAVTFEE